MNNSKFRGKKLEEILKYDFISIQYSTSSPFIRLETGGTCNCNQLCNVEGVCRGFEITSVDIERIELDRMACFIWERWNNVNSNNWIRSEKLKLFLDGYDQKTDVYCIENILKKAELFNVDSWKYKHRQGYYGQEIEYFTINEEKRSVILHMINDVIKIDSLEGKVKFLLNLEYGYVLDYLRDCKWNIELVDRESIYFPQVNHYKKAKKGKIYKNRKSDSIMGICLKENGVYKVVDGYNRISQTKHKMIKIFVAEKL